MLTQESFDKINELISLGWSFMLTHGDIYGEILNFGWECDFTRKLPSGRYDNHETGISVDDPNIAVAIAYDNIKAGKKLNLSN